MLMERSISHVESILLDMKELAENIQITNDGKHLINLDYLSAINLISYGHKRLKDTINEIETKELKELFNDVHDLVELVNISTVDSVRKEIGIDKKKPEKWLKVESSYNSKKKLFLNLDELPASFLINKGLVKLYQEIDDIHPVTLFEILDEVHDLALLVDHKYLEKAKTEISIKREYNRPKNRIKRLLKINKGGK